MRFRPVSRGKNLNHVDSEVVGERTECVSFVAVAIALAVSLFIIVALVDWSWTFVSCQHIGFHLQQHTEFLSEIDFSTLTSGATRQFSLTNCKMLG